MRLFKGEDITARLPASVEVTPRQAIASAELPGLLPPGTHVYIADIGDDTSIMIKAAARVSELGYVAVPHFAARRLTSLAALANRVQAMAQEAGVGNVLVVGGGLGKPMGVFSSCMNVLETGLFDRYGIKEIAIAGHPEGSPDFPDSVAIEALRLKVAFGERSDARLRIVTQFGFDPAKVIDWARDLRIHGIGLPVHVGVAGPASIATLLKYAAICGVGNSVSLLRKRAGALATLMSRFSPETMVAPLERHVMASPGSAIRQIHVFPFGQIGATTQWLRQRGSWPSDQPAPESTGKY